MPDVIPMDSLITAAARALAAGDPLGALKRVALRDDPPALALRGIAMAQLGDFARAKALLRRAARAFGPQEPVARARCVARRGRDRTRLARPGLAREGARRGAGDARQARRPGKRHVRAVSRGPAPAPDRAHRRGRAHARRARPRALPSRVENRPRAGGCGDRAAAPPREGGTGGARSGRARGAARTYPRADGGGRERSPRPEHARRAPDRAVARSDSSCSQEVETVLASRALVVDACRHVVRDGGTVVSLARRPVLFALARALGEAWPGDVPRDTLVARAFGIEARR